MHSLPQLPWTGLTRFFEVAAFLVILLPGLLWLVWWRREGDFASRLADAGGVSLGLPALAGLGTFLFGWRFSGVGLIGLYGLVGGVALMGCFRRYRDRIPTNNIPFPIPYSQLLILLAFALLLAFRYYQARSLALPAWVDSVHHTLLVRLFLETGGVPPTLEPYIQAPQIYHFGFHVGAALYAFFARLSPDQAVLIFGQFLNAFVSLAAYRLAVALWGDWRRGAIALLLTGFVFQMPAYYLTWGRYTLLAGLGLMILGMAAALDVIRSPIEREAAARLAVYTGALLLTHYFAAGLLALFFAALVLERTFFGHERPWMVGRERGLRALFLAGGAGFLLAAPWVGRVWLLGNRYIGLRVVGLGEALDEVYFPGYLQHLWFLLGPYRSQVLLGVGLAAFVLVGWRERTRPFSVWTLAFVLTMLPWGIRLRPFRPDHSAIVAFFPVALLIADGFVAPLEGEGQAGFRRLARGALAAALGGLLVWGGWETREIVNPVTVLAVPAEVDALRWIEQNTPEDARFFVNVAPWQYQVYRGVDGGWWILPLTGRETFLPPVLFAFGAPEQAEAVNARAARAAGFTECSDDFYAFLRENSLTHVYLGPSQGPLRPEGLEGCAGLAVIYRQAGVTIYKVELP